MTGYELFESEGFLDDYAAMKNKILLHVEEFLKFPKSVDVEPNTIIFGIANKLHLVKSKMKSNESFKKNTECVDVRDFLEWVENQRLLRDAEQSTTHTTDSTASELDFETDAKSKSVDIYIYNKNVKAQESVDAANDSDDKREVSAVKDDDNELSLSVDEHIASFNTQQEEENNVPGVIADTDEGVNLIKEDLCVPEVTTPSNKFVFTYLADQKPISAIASEFSVYDYNKKELVDGFIKKLRSSDYDSVVNGL